MFPIKDLIDAFTSSLSVQLQPQLQPFALKTSQQAEEVSMSQIMLNRILRPVTDCSCGDSCKCGDKCKCPACCCMGKCDRETKVWCDPRRVQPCSLPVDIIATPEKYIFQVDVPGVKRDQLKVECLPEEPSEHKAMAPTPERLAITVKRTFDKDDPFLRKERPFGQLMRCFTLPEDANADTISCKFEDGQLLIEVERMTISSSSFIRFGD